MKNNIKKEMMLYYNERAAEYDELYEGKYAKKDRFALTPSAYQEDAAKISEMAKGFGRDHLIDIACGTGVWLQSYARNCSRITLLDQSEKMLHECKKKVERLQLEDRVDFIQADFFEVDLENSVFDSALVGFLLSHFTPNREKAFFLKLKQILKPNGQLMIIDGAWNSERQKFRQKEGLQERILNNGRKFKVYKRYFEKADVEEISMRYCFEIKRCYTGKAMISAIMAKL